MIKQNKDGRYESIPTSLELTEKQKGWGWFTDSEGDMRIDDVHNGKQFMIAIVQETDEPVAYELYYGSKMDGFELEDTFAELDDACHSGWLAVTFFYDNPK